MGCATRLTRVITEPNTEQSSLDTAAKGHQPVLVIDKLHVGFTGQGGEIKAVNGVALRLDRGECLGVVGESGSGKSQLFLACLGLLASNGKASGSVKLEGQEILGLGRKELSRIRGNRISMIFQDPMTALTPHMSIRRQLLEVLTTHQGITRNAAHDRILEALEQVRIPDAAERLNRYPHELSGGMRQRVMIAMALLCRPVVLIGDEPTTALDVTIQADILDLFRTFKLDYSISTVLISHDLGVVATTCDRVLVLYAGNVVESGTTAQILGAPHHPYTLGLLASIPRIGSAASDRLQAIPGQPPDPRNQATGCPFAPRCQYRFGACTSARPELRRVAERHYKACHLELPERSA